MTRGRLSLVAACLLVFGTARGAGVAFLTTLGAGPTVSSSNTLRAIVAPNGFNTSVWFQWGTATNLLYSSVTTTSLVTAAGGTVTISVTVTGLVPGVPYHFRAVATNSAGMSRGVDRVLGLPKMELIGAAVITNAWGVPFDDPGVGVTDPTSTLGVSAGTVNMVAVKGDGTVVAWGDGAWGVTNVPSGLTNVVQVAAGDSHALALRGDGLVTAWGLNTSGQTNVPPGASNVVAIAAGSLHNLALKQNGQVVSWGTASPGVTNVPLSATNVVSIAAGNNFSVAVKSDGQVIMWGSGSTNVPSSATNYASVCAGAGGCLGVRRNRTLGDWGLGALRAPSPAVTNVVALGCRSLTGVGLLGNGQVFAWGTIAEMTNVPPALSNVVGVAAGRNHNAALTASGTVVVWGSADYGLTAPPARLAAPVGTLTTNGMVNTSMVGSNDVTYVYVDVAGATQTVTRTVSVLAAAPQALTLAPAPSTGGVATLLGNVTTGGAVTTAWFEWGATSAYGHGTTPVVVPAATGTMTLTNSVPEMEPGVVYHYRVVASNSVGIVMGTDRLVCVPQLRLNGPADITHVAGTPFEDPGVNLADPLRGVVAIAAGDSHALALKGDGSVVAWGLNTSGQTNVPPAATNVLAIGAGLYHSLAVRNDGRVIAWGSGAGGATNVPAGLLDARSVAGGDQNSLAARRNGRVTGWGATPGVTNVPGTLSNVVAVGTRGTVGTALLSDGRLMEWSLGSFAQVNDWSNVTAFACGYAHGVAVRADGTVSQWGTLALGLTNQPALTNAVGVSANVFYSAAVLANGRVVAWGTNDQGQTNVPPGLANVIAVAAACHECYALGSDGRVVVWGGNTNLPPDLNPPVTSILTNGLVNVDVPGSYVLTYTTTDREGNLRSTNRTVTVAAARPWANTLPADGLTNGCATLHATVNPAGVATAAWLEWGPSIAYGNTTPPVLVGAGVGTVAVQETLANLTPGVAYRCRIVASNTVGVTYGRSVVFGAPALELVGSSLITNVWGAAFTDPGVMVTDPGAAVVAVAAGTEQVIALQADGRVRVAQTGGMAGTNVPPGATGIAAVAAGDTHYVALKENGAVVAWGGPNLQGETNVPLSLPAALGIAAGKNSSLALLSGGSVQAWPNFFNPPPSGLANVAALSVREYNHVALTETGTVVTWGSGSTPPPPGLSNVTTVAAGVSHALAVDTLGGVTGWGSDTFGEATSPTPGPVKSVAAGDGFSVALMTDGTVAAWGRNFVGQTNVPDGLTGVVSVAAGSYGAYALRGDGTLVGWGLGAVPPPPAFAGVGTNGVVDTNALGVQVITYTATNRLGGVTTVTRTVVVADLMPPQLSLTGGTPLSFLLQNPWVDPGATAWDNHDGDISTNIVVTGAVDPFTAGAYTLLYSVTDGAGNTSVTNRNVMVVAPPVAVGGAAGTGGSGSFVFTFTGTPGANYSLETSSNLLQWLPFGSVQANESGQVVVPGTTGTNTPTLFFRLKFP